MRQRRSGGASRPRHALTGTGTQKSYDPTMLKFWGTVLALLAAAAYGMHRVDAAQTYRAGVLECRELELLDLTGQWARELGVQYDQLALACTMPWEDLAGASWVFRHDSRDRYARIWIDPEDDSYDLELVLVHELVHCRYPKWGEQRVHAEAERLWRAGRPWEKPVTSLQASTRKEAR